MKKLAPLGLLLVFTMLSAFGCQKPTEHVLPTPHPTGPANPGAVLYADSETTLGFSPASYDYHSATFVAQPGDYALSWACYTSGQGVPSSYQNVTQTYPLKISVYTSARAMLEPSAADISCGHGKPPAGIEALHLPSAGSYYLVITAGGPWTVEVDKA